MLDTAKLYKPILFLTIYLGIFHYIAILAFPPFIIFMAIYAYVFKSIKDDGRYIFWTLPLLLIDGIMVYSLVGPEILVLSPLIILFVGMIFMSKLAADERFYFGRTIVGMNIDDIKQAREAMKTKDPEDIADVAEYGNWG